MERLPDRAAGWSDRHAKLERAPKGRGGAFMTSPASSTDLPSSGSAPALETIGGVGDRLDSAEVTGFVQKALAGANLDGKRICLIVPDGTPDLPPANVVAGRSGGAGRPRQGGHRRDRPRYPSGDDRGAPRLASGLSPGA